MKWINKLKIAIIEDDAEAMHSLVTNLPKFEDINKAKESLSLVKVAIDLMNKKKEDTLAAMKKIKQTREFLNY